MTELAALPGAANPMAALTPTTTTVSLMEWAQELGYAHQIGSALASTDFVPLTLKKKGKDSYKSQEEVAATVAAVVLAGKGLGLDPMTSIQNIFVVHGRPAMYARTMSALVISAGHTIRRVESSERMVAYEGRRRGDTGPFTRVEWTIERATKAGYTSNPKYRSNPIEMLTAKCEAELCRVIAPDVLTGIAAVSAEEVELDDLGEVAAEQQAAAAVPRASTKAAPLQRQRRQPPAPVAPASPAGPPADLEPVNDEEDAAAEGVDKATGELPAEQPAETPQDAPKPAVDALCTEDQQEALRGALKAAGYESGGIRKRVSEFAGRPIASSKQLTETEAIDLTAQLWEEVDANTKQQADTEGAA